VAKKVSLLVRWLPSGIAENEWVDRPKNKADPIQKEVQISQLTLVALDRITSSKTHK